MLSSRAVNETPRRRRKGWLALGGLFALGVLWLAMSPGGGRGLGRSAAWTVGRAELGDGWQRVPPPIDLDTVARYARGIPGLAVPTDRFGAAWRDGDTGAVVTSITLVYDDPAEAQSLMTGRAVGLLASSFQLETEPVALAEADEAVGWRSPAYHAVAFRRGAYVVFLGTTLPPASPLAAPATLAEALLARPQPTLVSPSPAHGTGLR